MIMDAHLRIHAGDLAGHVLLIVTEEQERLYAAAPELLEALKLVQVKCQCEEYGARLHAIVSRAIAKAEGTPPGRTNQPSAPTQPTEAKYEIQTGWFWRKKYMKKNRPKRKIRLVRMND